jgi:hypothetical protein
MTQLPEADALDISRWIDTHFLVFAKNMDGAATYHLVCGGAMDRDEPFCLGHATLLSLAEVQYYARRHFYRHIEALDQAGDDRMITDALLPTHAELHALGVLEHDPDEEGGLLADLI